MGFNLESYKTIETDSCTIINSQEFFATIVLSSVNLEKKQINKCLLAKKKIENKLFNYNGYKLWLNERELDLITKIQKKMKKQADFYKIMLNKNLDIKSSKISANLKKQVSLFLSELESKESLFSIVYQIFLYQKLEFHGKVESLINSIITKDYIESFFTEYHIGFLSEDINEKIIDMLIEIKEKIKDKQLFESLISSISFGLNENLRDLVVDEFDIPNKLSYVQERIKSVHYGARLSFVWSHWIEKFSSTEELSLYLERGNIYKRIKSDSRYLGTLISFFPKDKSKRDILMSKYIEIKKSENPYLEDLSLRLILNNEFSNELINRNMKSKKPIFIQKRNFYRKMLKKNKAVLYSVYNLLKIGDIKKEYLIYALAVKSYGL